MPNMHVINYLLGKMKFYLYPLPSNIPYKKQLATGESYLCAPPVYFRE